MQGHPFGQIPGSWFPAAHEPVDHSISAVGKEYTTAWDLSQGPQPGSPAARSASPVRASSEPLYSFPSPNPFGNH